jgi:hypothetical protein
MTPIQAELFAPPDFAASLQRMLDPHRSIEKYGRVWHVSQPRRVGEIYHCKLGFVRTGEAPTVVYDEGTLDFVTAPIPTEVGQLSHFSVSGRTQILAFEAVPQIDQRTFVSRLRDFIAAAGEPYELQAINEAGRFEAWRASVDRVVHVDVKVLQPNPDVTEATVRTSARLTALNATLMEMKVASDRPDGVNTHAQELKDPIEHAGSGYGRTRALGIRGTAEVVFDSQNAARTRVIEVGTEHGSDETHAALDAVVREAEADEQPAQ